MLYVIHKLCVPCSMHPGSHKVGSQDAGDVGSHEQNVNTGYGIKYKRMEKWTSAMLMTMSRTQMSGC